MNDNFDLAAMRRMATLITPFAGQAILQCCDEIERWKARASLAQPASVPADGIDYEKLVADAWSLHKYRCGTPTCVAFKRGAEWQAKQAPQPAQAVPQLTGCNCRWDGETQVQWCELHLAHKEAIHDWAGRAKAAEAKLAAPQPEAQPSSEFDSPLSDFREGQWWVLELDAAARKNDATPDFKRAVAVVHHLLRAAAAPSAQAEPQQADDWQHLKMYGYAPGNYMSRCCRCGKTVSGLDKRAVSCRACAEELHKLAEQGGK